MQTQLCRGGGQPKNEGPSVEGSAEGGSLVSLTTKVTESIHLEIYFKTNESTGQTVAAKATQRNTDLWLISFFYFDITRIYWFSV